MIATILPKVNKNTLRSSAGLAYEAALHAALTACGCGRTRLLVTGPWEWMLQVGPHALHMRLAHVCHRITISVTGPWKRIPW
jgi:hypothetical protein